MASMDSEHVPAVIAARAAWRNGRLNIDIRISGIVLGMLAFARG